MPANTTHLIQSLDIAVYNPFKLVLEKCVSNFMLENAITTISKEDAMTIGWKAWRDGILDKATNIASVFRVAVLWPFYFPAMQRRLKFFKDGGIADSEDNPTWMRCWETIRTEVLSLPLEIDGRPQRRQTIELKNWLLSR